MDKTSYFYKVVAFLKDKTYEHRTWIFHSTDTLDVFANNVTYIMPEYTIDFIREIEYRNMEIVDFWDGGE